jgi:hypothetical protein
MSTLTDRLEALLGKNINQICPNGFHDAGLNHCAHFVGHALGLTSPYNCAIHTRGKKEAANIRVHETFAQCSKVGRWADADLSRAQMCFVTRKDVVDVSRKTMANIPQKHIGVFSDGMVYHYSNGGDRVVKQTPEAFLTTFDGLYSGQQALFFGYPADANIALRVQLTGAAASSTRKMFDITSAGTDWSAKLMGDGGSFFVGRETSNAAKGYFGLFFPGSTYYGPVYSGDDHAHNIGQWAYLLEATGWCESRNHFNLINTYDRAKFTFGFYQLAAHTPRDNLILLFRALFADPEMADYFPELKLIDGRVHRVDSVNGVTDLEEEFTVGDETTLQFFMNYLNPRRKELDKQEILHSARLIHWANTSRSMQKIQVKVANDILQKKMSQRYQAWFNLDGRSDLECLLVADIMHQGRAGRQAKTVVRRALMSLDPVAALKSAGKIGTKTYSAALNEFV